MKSLLSILTLSLNTHAFAFNLAQAAAIERNAHATPTITKTIYHTEVRRLSSNYKAELERSGRAISDHTLPPSPEWVSDDASDHAASFMSEPYLQPRKPGGEKPTVLQIPVTGVPVIFSTKKVEPASSNDATKRGQPLNVNPVPLEKRKTNLYNIKVDLAPEGYISVYITNSTASTFCESEVQQDADDTPKAHELHLTFLNATKTIAIPIHKEVVASFCLEFKDAENIDGPKSGKVSASSKVAVSTSDEKAAKTLTNEETTKGTPKSPEHTSSKETAAVPKSDISRSLTSVSSTTKTRTSDTENISDESQTLKSTTHVSTETKSSNSGSAASESAVASTTKTRSHDRDGEETSIEPKTNKSAKEASTLTTSSDADSSSDSKPKSSASKVNDDTSETVESSYTSTKTKSADADSSEIETKTSPSSKTKSTVTETEDTGDPSDSTALTEKSLGSHSTDSDASSTPKATPAALPASTFPDTTTDELFTESSMNSFYPYIASYLETAHDLTPTASNTDQPSLTTTDSVNGAAKRGRIAGSTSAAKDARAEHAAHSAVSSMSSSPDYSWMGTASTDRLSDSAAASSTARLVVSANAATSRLKPPSLIWRWWKPVASTNVLDERRNSGPDEEPEQEQNGFFKIIIEDKEPTRVSPEKSRVEEIVVATKLAHKQQDDNEKDNDKDDEKDNEKHEVEDEEGENEVVDDEDKELDEKAEPDKEMEGGDDEKPTSTRIKPSRTKTSAEENNDTPATATASAEVDEEATPTKDNSAKDDEKAAPTSKTPEDDDPPADNDDEEPKEDTPDEDEDEDEDTTTKSSHKPKSTKPTSSTTSDTDEEPMTTSTRKSTKSKTPIPSLASYVSFEFPSTAIALSTSPLPTPPPPPTGTAPAPISPIIWDPDCPQLSTSTLTAPNGLTTTLPVTVGLGCWRSLPNSLNVHNETSGSTGHLKSSAFTILSDPQNRRLGVACWWAVGAIAVQWFVGHLQFVRGEWHLGRRFVWWVGGLEVLGVGRWGGG